MHEQASKKHFASLDAFRGLAAMMVVLYHSQFFVSTQPNAFVLNSGIFVDFFFVLSGFVMAYSYLERIKNGFGFVRYTILRFARLYPLHLFTLLLWVPFVLAKALFYHQGIGATDPLVANTFASFLQNLFLMQGVGANISWNYPSWSVSVEFLTYLLFFGLVMFVLGLIRRYLLGVLIVLGAAIPLFMTLVISEHTIMSNLMRGLSEFFIGAAVYLLHARYPVRLLGVGMATVLESLLLVVTILCITMISSTAMFYLVVVLFAIMVYWHAGQRSGMVSRFLELPVMQYLGHISYSIYMTHALIVTIVYNIAIYIAGLEVGGVAGMPHGLLSPYAWIINLLLLASVLGVSAWTYRAIELPGKRYVIKKLLPRDKKGDTEQ
jgi:peptidoglycan/LPS O-acetylase OafA/YrhL